MKKIIFLTIISVLFITACDKSDPEPVCKTDATSISGSYRITAATYKADPSSAEADYYSILFPDACQTDDVYTFQTNGAYQLMDAGTVCYPSGDDDGTWSVNGNSMVVDGESMSIESFDCKTLIIFGNDLLTSGDKLRLTFTKQ